MTAGRTPHPDEESPTSAAPTSRVRPDETQSFAIARDGTRLFVRSRSGPNSSASPSRYPGPIGSQWPSAMGDPRARLQAEVTAQLLQKEGAQRDGAQAEGAASAVRAFLCDGIACDGFIWKYLWDDLDETVPLTHWHYRGHGRSAPPADPDRLDITAHADDLSTVRRFVGDPPCVLIGHSMGVQVCLENYRLHPENVRGLVLICGSFGRVTETFHGVPILQHVLPRLLDTVLKRPNVARAIWSRIPADISLKLALKWGEIDADKIHPEDMMPYLQHVAQLDLPMFLRMLRAAGEHTAEDLLPEVNVPALIIAGERDTFTPSYLMKQMAERMPDAELMVVKSGTHVASIEQPELVDDRIAQFIRTRVLR